MGLAREFMSPDWTGVGRTRGSYHGDQWPTSCLTCARSRKSLSLEAIASRSTILPKLRARKRPHACTA
jgi:hypothetical protein